MAGTVKIKQVKSKNGANHAQRETLRSLKLGKIDAEAKHKDSPQTPWNAPPSAPPDHG